VGGKSRACVTQVPRQISVSLLKTSFVMPTRRTSGTADAHWPEFRTGRLDDVSMPRAKRRRPRHGFAAGVGNAPKLQSLAAAVFPSAGPGPRASSVERGHVLGAASQPRDPFARSPRATAQPYRPRSPPLEIHLVQHKLSLLAKDDAAMEPFKCLESVLKSMLDHVSNMQHRQELMQQQLHLQQQQLTLLRKENNLLRTEERKNEDAL
jgi:hypothetical protein